MEPRLLKLFVCEVERQAQFALIAAQDLALALDKDERDRAWASIQSLLVATGNVSKLLWPHDDPKENAERRAARAARGETLRKMFSVAESSALRSRKFRNIFEHFDKELEDWFASHRDGAFVDSNFGVRNAIGGVPSTAYVRNYEPATNQLIFRGKDFELGPVIDALQTLRCHALSWIERNRR